jgi:ribosomal protein L7/L12
MSDFDIIQLRARVAELEDKLEKVYRHLGLAYDSNAPAEDPRLIACLRQGNLIEAIKVYRENHNVSLAEAKAAVEQMRGRL